VIYPARRFLGRYKKGLPNYRKKAGTEQAFRERSVSGWNDRIGDTLRQDAPKSGMCWEGKRTPTRPPFARCFRGSH